MTPIPERKEVVIATVAEAYSNGDVIGLPVAVDVSNNKGSAQGVLLQALNIISGQNKKLKVAIFIDVPTCGANNASFQPDFASIKNLVDVVAIDTLTAYTAGNFGTAKQLALPVFTGINRKFWVVLIAGENQTFAAANAVTISPSYYID